MCTLWFPNILWRLNTDRINVLKNTKPLVTITLRVLTGLKFMGCGTSISALLINTKKQTNLLRVCYLSGSRLFCKALSLSLSLSRNSLIFYSTSKVATGRKGFVWYWMSWVVCLSCFVTWVIVKPFLIQCLVYSIFKATNCPKVSHI